MQLSRQWTVTCTPQYRQLVAKSRPIAGQLDILKNAIEQAVDSHTYPHPVQASGDQEQYYIRSALHSFAYFMFSCCRGMSYIGICVGDMSSWTLRNLCKLLSFVVAGVVVTVSCCGCCSFLIVDPQLYMNNNKNNNKIHSNNKNNQNKKNNICRLLFLLLLLWLLLLCNFVVLHL